MAKSVKKSKSIKDGSSKRSSKSGSSRSKSGGSSAAGNLVSEAERHFQKAKSWFEEDRKRLIALGITLLLLFLFITMSHTTASAADPGLKGTLVVAESGYGGDSDNDFDEPVEKPKPKRRKESTPALTPEQIEEDLGKATHRKLAIELPAEATSYNVMLRPMETKGSSVICPDKGGGKQNKICSQAYAEYLFDVTKPGVYYLYVETLGPNINDNSLWVGAPMMDSSTFTNCPDVKAGALVPHKHVKSKKWLCCPKYLASNAKKGQGAFYCECCISSIGPYGKDLGCILDLEVDANPHWNMLPREIKVASISEPFPIRLYAREDGTAITRVMLSASPALKSI